jgi:hypothetical protein
VTGRFRVYWQVVNTGREAEDADCLRGGFSPDAAVRGGLSHSESTLYRGQHSIECFIVKNGQTCRAQRSVHREYWLIWRLKTCLSGANMVIGFSTG